VVVAITFGAPPAGRGPLATLGAASLESAEPGLHPTTIAARRIPTVATRRPEPKPRARETGFERSKNDF
jgi:hypothetical protein